MTSQFDLTRFYEVIIRNCVFLTRFSNSIIPDPFLSPLTHETIISGTTSRQVVLEE